MKLTILYAPIIMTTLKTITLEKLSASLPADLLNELATCYLQDALVPKITNIDELFDGTNLVRKDFLKLLHEFSSSFPQVVKEVLSLENFWGEFSGWHSYDDWKEYMDEEGFIDLDKIIYRKNGIYYCLAPENIRGYKMHNDILQFFWKRNLKPRSGYDLVPFSKFSY